MNTTQKHDKTDLLKAHHKVKDNVLVAADLLFLSIRSARRTATAPTEHKPNILSARNPKIDHFLFGKFFLSSWLL
jgi:hypothetical protein